MIEYLTSDPKKQISMNLELYFEIYEFLYFKMFFFNFYEFILDLF